MHFAIYIHEAQPFKWEKIIMYYLEQLIATLQATEITNKAKEKFSLELGIQKIVELFYAVENSKKKVFFIGNGGSAAIASHMTVDFFKNGEMKTYSLNEASVLTCLGNDYGYEYVFSKQLESLADKNDLLVAISSSGNSLSIINAVIVARNKECRVVTLSGFCADNKLINLGDYNIYVPLEHYGIVESIHNLLLQQIVDTIKDNN